MILILLVAIAVKGQPTQSLADAARKERERRAAISKVPVITTEEARGPASAASSAPAPASSSPAAPAASTPAVSAAPVPKPADEALKKYNDEVAKLKARIVQLQDQDTAVQLQINDLKNAIQAPVIDQPTQDQAKQQLAQAQDQQVATEKDLADTKKALEELEAQGPPKP